MTNQDRGAYAPQADAPLTFDARSRGGGGRRPMPMTLIGSVVVLAVLGAAGFMFYRSGSHQAAPPPVGAALGPIKSAPDAASQPHDPGAGLDVYSPQNVPTAAAKPPAFAPSPEQPMPRPAPKPVQIAAAAPAPGLKVEAVKPAPVHLAPPAAPAKSAVVASTKTVTTTTTKPLLAKAAHSQKVDKVETKTAGAAVTTTTTTKTKPVAIAAAVASSKPDQADDAAPPALAALQTASGSGGSAVQIGAFSSAALADKGYGDVAAKMAGEMGGHSKAVEPLSRDGRTLYRTTVRGFSDHAAAAAFCASLKAKGAACIVKG